MATTNRPPPAAAAAAVAAPVETGGGGGDVSTLAPLLRWIEIPFHEPSSDGSNTKVKKILHWPCLLFDTPAQMNSTLPRFVENSSGGTTPLYSALKKKQVSDQTILLMLRRQKKWSKLEKTPVAYLLGGGVYQPLLSQQQQSGEEGILKRVVFAPSPTTLHAKEDVLDIVFGDASNSNNNSSLFEQDAFQSALQEMTQIMGLSSDMEIEDDDDDDDEDDEAILHQHASSQKEDDPMEVVAEDSKPPATAATATATSKETSMDVEASSSSLPKSPNTAANARARRVTMQEPPPSSTTTAAPAVASEESTETTTAPAAAAAASSTTTMSVTAPQEKEVPAANKPASETTAAAGSSNDDSQEDTTMADEAAMKVAIRQNPNGQEDPSMTGSATSTTATATTGSTTAQENETVEAAAQAPNEQSDEASQGVGGKEKESISTATASAAPSQDASSLSVARPSQEETKVPSQGDDDDDDDDMPMADADEDVEAAAADDDDMETPETNRKQSITNRVVAKGDDASESVLVQATNATSINDEANQDSNSSTCSSSESVLVQGTATASGASSNNNSRSTRSASQKKAAARAKKNRRQSSSSNASSTTTTTPSERTTRSSGRSLDTPSGLALGQLGSGSSKGSRSSRKAASSSEPTDKKKVFRDFSFSPTKKLLQKGGYSFDGNLFCRPGMDPKENSQAILGRDYFDSLQAFREDLCAYGVDDCSSWTDTDREVIESWVRLTVVKSVDLAREGLPDHDRMSNNEALRLLLDKLGYRYKPATSSDAYYLPGVKKGKGDLGKTMFLDEKDLFDHLQRFGLSDEATREKVTNRELLSLEVYLSQPGHRDITNTFVRISPIADNASAADATEPASGRRSARRRLSSGSAVSTSKSTVSQSSTKSTGGSKGSRKKRPHVAALSAAVASKKPKSGRPYTPTTKKPHAAWSPPDYSPAPASTVMDLHNSTSTVVTVESLSPRENRTLPVFEGTDKERLMACINALTQNGQVDRFSYGGGESRFEHNLGRVMTFLKAAIVSEGEHGGCPGDPTALYICGVPGIGKTSGVKWCCNKMIEEVEKGNIDVEDNCKPLLCEINATSLQHVQNPMKVLLQSMSRALGLSKSSAHSVERRLKRGGLVILVVDEIDTLVSASKNGKVGKLPAVECVVQKLLEWTSNVSLRLAVIGISNSTGNDKYCRLQELGKFQDVLTFNAYGVKDIVSILETRIGQSVMDKNAMEFIGRKISNESGDARKALKLAAKAVQICLDKIPQDKDRVSDGPLVKIMHAHLANRAGAVKLNERIGGLPTFTKGVLCVLSALGREDAVSVPCGSLKSFVSSCMRNGRETEIHTAEDFRVSVETLRDLGLLRMDDAHAERALGPGGNAMALSSAPVRLGVQSEDVESAIVEELGQTAFFMKMRELAIEKRDELVGNK